MSDFESQAMGDEQPCGSTDPFFKQCGLPYGHKEHHVYTIPAPEEFFVDDADTCSICGEGNEWCKCGGPSMAFAVRVTEDRTPIPLYIQDAVNHAIHTSRIDGRERPISLCFVAVRAAMKAMEEHCE